MDDMARRATTAVSVVAAATCLGVVSPAESATTEPSRVTVHATDSTPASGQTFRLYGAVRSEGERVPATIRVKTFRNGGWTQLAGAVMHTNRLDRYRIRIVLQMKGERLLRVVANPDGNDIAKSHRTITVTVH